MNPWFDESHHWFEDKTTASERARAREEAEQEIRESVNSD